MTTGSMMTLLACLAWGLATSDVQAQSAINSQAVLYVAQAGLPTPAGTSYGYQPYDDRNPTGFSHPNGMGYGSYYMTPKYHGHRIPTMQDRKFRGN